MTDMCNREEEMKRDKVTVLWARVGVPAEGYARLRPSMDVITNRIHNARMKENAIYTASLPHPRELTVLDFDCHTPFHEY